MSLSSQIKVPAQVKGAVGGGSGGGATSLDGLSDVVITTPADGQFVRYNGTNFVNQALSAADIPGADAAVAHQVPTSDGAGGFSWEDPGASFVGTSSNLTLGDGSAGIVPAGNFGNLSAADIPVFWVATTTRSTNAFSGSLPTTPTLTAGLAIRWQVPSAPSGAATYNLNSLGAKNIYVRGSANVAADLPANRIVTMVYDGTQWQVTAVNTVILGDLPFTGTPTSAKFPDGSGAWRALVPGDIPYSGYYAGKSADQSVAANTTADVTMTTNEQTSADITHSTSTNPAEFTINTTQKYSVDVDFEVRASTGAAWNTGEVRLYVNGVMVRRKPCYTYFDGTTGLVSAQGSLTWEGAISAGQIVKVVFANTGATNALILSGQSASVNQCSIRIQGRGV